MNIVTCLTILGILGIVLIAAAMMVDSEFHPPGSGYERERRQRIIGNGLLGVGLFSLLLAVTGLIAAG